ncbi:MAG: shikimate dehydrogenase [Xanthobacteraceae bacterium]
MVHADRFLLAGVMGWPVMHSRSPKLHNYWFVQYGLSGSYLPLAIPPERLADALHALSALGFSGCNLTIPHKQAALAIVDRLDPLARRIGAVNCIVVAPDQSLQGYNFDAFGFIESIREAHPAWRAGNGPVVVIGAGGAARAVLVGLMEQGAREIRLINRTRSRAAALLADLGGPLTVLDWQQRNTALAGAAMLVNATSLGMAGEDALDISLAKLPQTALVSDIVYIPRETALLKEARLRGNATVNGLGMLLHQARPAFAAWFGVMPKVTPELCSLIEATL